ncbi:MAG: siroheme synthase [Sphingomonas sp.]|nr:siroheme synthase [Sphingomonas sp.]
MTLHSLPLFVRLAGRAVILLGEGAGADAKRRLLERVGAVIVDESGEAALAIVAIEDEAEAQAAVSRLKARGILVNAVDRPALCDFTVPAIIDRAPVLIAIGTGGVSAGLAAALRQRLETMLPADLGRLANALFEARAAMRERWPDGGARRRALGNALAPGGQLDPFGFDPDVGFWLDDHSDAPGQELYVIRLRSLDPDELTVREARALAQADRLYHPAGVPAAILDRARADADRFIGLAPRTPPPGLTIQLEMPA